jgi:ferredoxin
VTPRVTIDSDLCIGSGECVRLVPGAVAIDEARGVSVPLPGVADADLHSLEEAERGCPTGAFRLVRNRLPDEEPAR